MSRVACPHCTAAQEVPQPAPGESARHSCSQCHRPFAVRGAPAAGTAASGAPTDRQAGKPPPRVAGSTHPLPGETSDAPAGTPRAGSGPVGATQRLGDGPDPTAGFGGTAARRTPGIPPGLPEPPSRMGPYEIRGTIGAGGMGVVYRGWDAQLNRHVAVKTLRPDLAKDSEYCERFLREARAAASVSHPNVTQIYFIGEEGGQPFFAMECLEGNSLEALVREEGRLSPEKAVGLVRQAAAGLKAAAARGIIHRDIKPSNLVLTADGTVKVTDFGLAKLVVADAGLTMTGEVLGSPNYVSPEQASGLPVDLRSDIYSLGASLFELVCGRPPFEGPTPVSIILKHVREPVRSPRSLNPDLPYPLVNLIQRMLSKRPDDRPRDYDALTRELDRLVLTAGGSRESGRARATTGLADGRGAQAAGKTAAGPSGAWVIVPIGVLVLVVLWAYINHQDRPGAPSGEGSEPVEVLASTTDGAPAGPSTDGASRAFRIPPRLRQLRESSRANLQFVDNTHEVTTDGRLRVKGTVVNSGSVRAVGVRIRVTITGSSGRVLGNTVVTLNPPLLAPNQSGSFEAFFTDPREPVNIRTELNWNS